jgi:hypothetical protein
MAINVRKYAIFSSCITLFIATSSLCHAFDVHDVADPPAASVIYVGDVIQNGLPMQMKQFSTDSSIAQLLAFYKQRWSDTSKKQDNVPSYLEKRVGEWYILSKMENEKSVVVQARKAKQGTIEGYISVTDMSRISKPNRWTREFPRMPGTQLISNTESVDKGRVAYTLILSNDHSVSDNNGYYRESMHNDGWQYIRGGEKSSTAMLYFKKERLQCDIAVTEADDGQTVIFANLVEINENS